MYIDLFISHSSYLVLKKDMPTAFSLLGGLRCPHKKKNLEF